MSTEVNAMAVIEELKRQLGEQAQEIAVLRVRLRDLSQESHIGTAAQTDD